MNRTTEYLREHAAELALALLGEPTKKNAREWRWGNRGSLAVVVAGERAGAWKDHEADEGGGPVELIMRVRQLDAREALSWARDWAGGILDSWTPPLPPPSSSRDENLGQLAMARRLWEESRPVAATDAERYLRRRGLDRGLDPVRFHPRVFYPGTGPDDPRRGPHPAVLFLATSGAVQAVYLQGDNKAFGKDSKRTFGRYSGSCVVLQDQPGEPLILAEGPETALSAVVAGVPGTIAASLSISNFANAGTSTGARSVLLLGDGDPLDAPSRNTLKKAAREIAATGREVRVLDLPPTGDDLNDLLQRQGSEEVRRLLIEALAGPPWIDPDAPAPVEPFYRSSPLPLDQARELLDRTVVDYLDRARLFSDAQHAIETERLALLADAQRQHAGDPPALERAQRTARSQAIESARARFGPIVDEPAPKLALRTAAGTGKTRTVSNHLERPDFAQTVVWFLVPTHAKAREIVAEHPSFVHVKGRNEETCRRHELAEEIARSGMIVQDTLCFDPETKARCSHYQDCPYQQQRHLLKERSTSAPGGVYVGSHEYLRVPSGAPKPDMVVIDESHWKSLATTIDGISTVTLLARRWEMWAEELPEDEKWSVRKERDDRAKKRGDEFVDAVTCGRPILMELRNRGFDRQQLTDAAARLRRRAAADAVSIKPEMTDAQIRMALSAWRDRKLTRIAKLLSLLAEEIDLTRDEAIGVEYRPSRQDPEGDHADGLLGHYIRPPNFRSRPVLILDASNDHEITRRIWGDDTREVRIDVERQAEIVQIGTKGFSNQSIKGVRTDGQPLTAKSEQEAARLRREIAAVVAGAPGPVLVVSNKGVEEVLRCDLPAGTTTAHFAALRGVNAFENHRTAIIVGREQPGPTDVEAYARALHRLDPDPLVTARSYQKATRARRMANGRHEMATTQVHPDDRVQRFLEQIREREIEQAVDRLRLVYNQTPKLVLIAWSGVVDVTVDRVVSWEALVLAGERLTGAWARTGVIPLGRKEAARVHAGRGWTEKTARSDLAVLLSRRVALTPNRFFYLATGPLKIVGYRLASNPRGELLQAIVLGATAAEVRARLVAAVGPILAFELVSPASPLPVPMTPTVIGTDLPEERLRAVLPPALEVDDRKAPVELVIAQVQTSRRDAPRPGATLPADLATSEEARRLPPCDRLFSGQRSSRPIGRSVRSTVD